jgi:hypothetical protein
MASLAYAQEQTSAGAAASFSHAKRTHSGKTWDSNGDAAPCPRGTWKDDPVCSGEGAPDALPTPSAGSATSSVGPSNGPTIKPTANINSRPGGPGQYQAGVIYQSNGNVVTSNYGGGIKMELPF